MSVAGTNAVYGDAKVPKLLPSLAFENSLDSYEPGKPPGRRTQDEKTPRPREIERRLNGRGGKRVHLVCKETNDD